MKKPLYEFKDTFGTFVSESAHRINTLYFPLCNTHPFMSSISPDLHGDIKTNNNSFLLEPVSRIDLSTSRASRNFWCYISPQKIWSATGVSKDIRALKEDICSLEAGLLWQKITRVNKRIGLKAEITSFVPATGDPVEIMRVDITNVTGRPLTFVPAAAIPIYARSADSLRDHRHVTSLLNRMKIDKSGVIVTPTLLFDESGHKKNKTSYFVLGIDEDLRAPQYIYSTQEEFCGDDSDLEAPDAIYQNALPKTHCSLQGKEAMGALRFKSKTLSPGKKYSYIILMGITTDKHNIPGVYLKKYNTIAKIEKSLVITKDSWQKKSAEILLKSPDTDYDNWFRWVTIQPTLRKIFGCSFLPDFDYGRGGRGWRDLWQDCLSLILTNPKEVRSVLLNNFKGVRIDGSNATIIGQKPGEFIADRNNISRVWMDHGIWPLVTTLLYIHQTGDSSILLEGASYFRDRHLSRSQGIDLAWTGKSGNLLKTKHGLVYKGTILEHILVQNLVQFFNVGPHNHIRLEGADWNDGLDMASQNGESVAFTAMYAKNLKDICALLAVLGRKKMVVFKELKILLDTLTAHPVSYGKAPDKLKILESYFKAVNGGISGKKISIPVRSLIRDLRKKSEWIHAHIQRNEWLKNGFFNGYYDNDKKRVEGKFGRIMRMTLTGSTFPIMSGIASNTQIKSTFAKAKLFLQDKTFGGFRLNTDFKTEQHSLGRAFSFNYGDKENGAYFSHMSVMCAYSLYARGFAKEGYEVLNSIYCMAKNTAESKIYPCLPEYFNSEGRGMYSYLTGSASWFALTMLTQVCGIRGEYGNLVIEPKLTAAQFAGNSSFSITAHFAGKKIEVLFKNPGRKEFGRYSIAKVSINGRIIDANLNLPRFLITRTQFLALARRPLNTIEVILD